MENSRGNGSRKIPDKMYVWYAVHSHIATPSDNRPPRRLRKVLTRPPPPSQISTDGSKNLFFSIPHCLTTPSISLGPSANRLTWYDIPTFLFDSLEAVQPHTSHCTVVVTCTPGELLKQVSGTRSAKSTHLIHHVGRLCECQ
jgi:hypothetical protein